MSQTVVIGGSIYVIPDQGERSWGQNVTDLLVAVSARLISAGVGGIDSQYIGSSPVNVASGKTYLVDTTGDRVLNLPAPSASAFFTVKDISGRAWLRPITIARFGSESIDGVASNKTLTIPNGNWLFVCDGVDWYGLRDDDRFTVGVLTGWRPVIGLTPSVNTSGQDAIIQFSGYDMTGQIPIGSRIKFTQSGVTKYGFVKAATFSTNTLVSIVTPTANTISASSIDAESVYVSLVENPVGFPSFFDWVPTVNGVSSTTTAAMQFWISGRMIFIAFHVAGVSNSVAFGATNGPVLFTSQAGAWLNAAAAAQDSSAYITDASFSANPTTRNLLLLRDGAGSNWTASGNKMMKGTLIAPFAG